MRAKPRQFDPYHKWLGIPPKDQPADHYRLLAIERFEADPEVIETAANVRMAYLHGCTTGEQAEIAERLLNEIAAARVCLLDPRKKADYDARLRTAKRATSPAPPQRAPVPAPPASSSPSHPSSVPVRQMGPEQQSSTARRIPRVPAAPRAAIPGGAPRAKEAINARDPAGMAVASGERTARARRRRRKLLVAASVSFLAASVVLGVVDGRRRRGAPPVAEASVATLDVHGRQSVSKATDTPAITGTSSSADGAAAASVQPSPDQLGTPTPAAASSPPHDPSAASATPAGSALASASPAPEIPPAPSPPAHEEQTPPTPPNAIGPWTAFNLDGNQVIDNFVRITHGRLSTKTSYSGALDIRVQFKPMSDKARIRVFAFDGAKVELEWNRGAISGELRVRPPISFKRTSSDETATVPIKIVEQELFHSLRWLIKDGAMWVYLDDKTVFRELEQSYDLSKPAPTGIETEPGSVVDAFSLNVTTLGPDGQPVVAKVPPRIKHAAPKQPARKSAAKKPSKGKVLYYVWEVHPEGGGPFKLKLFTDGTANDFSESQGKPNFKWSHVGSAVVLRWPQGWVDSLMMSADGREMSGKNQYNRKVRATLIGTNLDAK